MAEKATESGTTRSTRLSVDLSPQAAEEFEQLKQQRGLTTSQAVRLGLSLLARCDTKRYQVILKDKHGEEPDKEIIVAHG